MMHVESDEPIAKRLRHTPDRYKVVVASVAILDCRGRPPAVFRRIRTVVVDPIQSVPLGGPGAHIFLESLQGKAPAITYANAPSAIIPIAFDPGIFASMQHAFPDVIKWLVSHRHS
jgi:hypothetical protein